LVKLGFGSLQTPGNNQPIRRNVGPHSLTAVKALEYYRDYLEQVTRGRVGHYKIHNASELFADDIASVDAALEFYRGAQDEAVRMEVG